MTDGPDARSELYGRLTQGAPLAVPAAVVVTTLVDQLSAEDPPKANEG